MNHTNQNISKHSLTQAEISNQPIYFQTFFFLEECIDCVKQQKKIFDVNLVCGACWLIQLSSTQF